MPPDATRDKFLDAAIRLIRRDGYEATSVGAICAAVGLTKGAFFHHFAGKEDWAIAAAGHWGTVTDAVFDAADYRGLADPAERVLGYVALRRAILVGPIPDVTCLLGTMVQEVYATTPRLRDACRAGIEAHVDDLARDVAAARPSGAAWDPRGVAFHIQAVLQGAFVLAKATGDVAVAQECVDHLAAYLRHLLVPQQKDASP